MKKAVLIFSIFLFAGLTYSSCSKEEEKVGNGSGTDPNPSIELSIEEKDCLIYLREEEKLARDVYLYSFDLYGMKIFSNISSSEQRHMDEVLVLLESYDLEDPATDVRGEFNNADLQKLYNDLTAQSDKSLLDALIVGATIEDLDIFDLNSCLANIDKADIQMVFEHLRCGSRNHMRAYTGQIEKNGGVYSPQYISETEYLEIITSDQEKVW